MCSSLDCLVKPPVTEVLPCGQYLRRQPIETKNRKQTTASFRDTTKLFIAHLLSLRAACFRVSVRPDLIFLRFLRNTWLFTESQTFARSVFVFHGEQVWRCKWEALNGSPATSSALSSSCSPTYNNTKTSLVVDSSSVLDLQNKSRKMSNNSNMDDFRLVLDYLVFMILLISFLTVYIIVWWILHRLVNLIVKTCHCKIFKLKISVLRSEGSVSISYTFINKFVRLDTAEELTWCHLSHHTPRHRDWPRLIVGLCGHHRGRRSVRTRYRTPICRKDKLADPKFSQNIAHSCANTLTESMASALVIYKDALVSQMVDQHKKSYWNTVKKQITKHRDN